MATPRFSMRASLSFTIVVMGLLGMLLALVTGEIYRHLALDNYRSAIVELVSLKTRELLEDLEKKSRDLGLALQRDDLFRRAFDERDAATLGSLLDNQFHQYFVTAGVIDLKYIRVLDVQFQPVAASQDAGRRISCPAVTAAARARHGADRLQILSGRCVVGGRPSVVAFVPIGGLRLKGYLEIVSDPVFSLIAIESALGMPLRLTLPDGQSVYRSAAWPAPSAMGTMLVATHALATSDHEPILNVAVLEDVKRLHGQLARTRYAVMLAAGVVTLLGVLVALLILERTALKPLHALRRQLHLIRKDRTRLGEQLPVSGNIEITELSQDFNALSKQLKDLYETLERMAYTDALTELPNRARLHARLEAGARGPQGEPGSFALLVMDLDRFKEVNDTLGHDVGDELLRQVGARLKDVLRGSDVLARLDDETRADIDGEVVARLGGDEFAAVLPDVKQARDAIAVAEKLLQSLERPFTIAGNGFTVGMSVGIALYPEHGTDQNTLLRQADAAMYEAKRSHSGYALADAAHEYSKRQQFDIERGLRRAIEDKQLELHYQPKIDVGTRQVRCAEALLHWRRSDGSLVPPDQFIPTAEQTGLIRPLTLWVLDRALADCAAWHRAGFAIDLAVNLSAVNLHDPNLVEQIAGVLERRQMRASCLVLELTESAIMSEPEHALQILTRLDAMGVRLSVDDFGTGYSSLAYLKRLPVDEIKIDKSFVMDMRQDNNDAVIVRSTIDLAHNMDLKVVGEGVESNEIMALLASLGCDLAQGYHISRPLPYAQFLAWLGSANVRTAV